MVTKPKKSKKINAKNIKGTLTLKNNKVKKEEDNINPLNGLPYSEEYYELQAKISRLPASKPEIQKKLKDTIMKNDLTIIQAATGAGKSVVVAPSVLKFFDFKKKVIVTQPKSINTEVARFAGKVLDDTEGNRVNFAYRFNNMLTPKTILSYQTDGRVLNYFFDDPDFNQADIIILDEVHEKNVNVEMLLLFMKKILMKTGNKKKLILMSATMDINAYKKYFTHKNINIGTIEIPGVSYPIKRIYLKDPIKDTEYIKKSLELIEEIIDKDPTEDLNEHKDILVFVPSISEIVSSCNMINRELNKKLKERVVCMNLYSGIPEGPKKLIMNSKEYRTIPDQNGNKPVRKIVFATNIAESGVTIDGLKYVIDSGKTNEVIYDAQKNMNIMKKVLIPRSSVDQRIGRSGRTNPGTSYLLYTEKDYNSLDMYKKSDITNTDLSDKILSLLSLKGMNIKKMKDIFNDMIEPPNEWQIDCLLQRLKTLGIVSGVNDKDELTFIGQCIKETKMEFRHALAYMASFNYQNDDPEIVYDVLTIVTMLAEENNLEKWFNVSRDKMKEFHTIKRKYTNGYSDIIGFLSVFKDFRKHNTSFDAVKKWTNKNMMNMGLLFKANKMRSQNIQNMKQFNVTCRIPNSELNSNKDNMTRNDMILNCFKFAYQDQVAYSDSKNKYVTDNPKLSGNCNKANDISFSVDPGKYNFVKKLGNEISYISMNDILGNIRPNGIINI